MRISTKTGQEFLGRDKGRLPHAINACCFSRFEYFDHTPSPLTREVEISVKEPSRR